MTLTSEKQKINLNKRHRKAKFFAWFCKSVTCLSVLILFILLWRVSANGFAWLDWQFLTSFPSRFPENAGIKSAIAGTFWLIILIALISIPIGVSSAIYLEEFARQGKISKLIEVNISNLAGVPSIVYGILGLAVFVRFFALDRSLLAGALTMSLLILPVIIIASREAIRAVPRSIRYAAFSLGASRWQTTWSHILPASFPGIVTGIILSLSRAIGETAPLIMIGALTFVAFTPSGPMDAFTALPIQIYNWASRPQEEFHDLAAAGIVVLLVILLVLNASAIYLRNRFERGKK
jgi:phosphate transport system permease protein